MFPRRCLFFLNVATLLSANGVASTFGATPLFRPIGLNSFSGSENVVTFAGGDTSPADSFTFDGVKFTNLYHDGFIFVQPGRDPFFSNIPGASLGAAGRTTGTLVTQLLIELPVPARRYGMLLSSGTPATWTVSAFSGNQELGSVVAAMPGSLKAAFAGFETTAPFDRVVVLEHGGTGNGQNDAWDDIRYEIVPEPSIGSLGMVLALLVVVHGRATREGVGRYRAGAGGLSSLAQLDRASVDGTEG